MKNIIVLMLSIFATVPGFANPKFLRTPDAVPNQYIVKMTAADPSEASRLADKTVAEHGGKVLFRYSSLFSGFALEIPEPAAVALSRNPKVRYVEEVARVYLPSGEPSFGTSTNYQNTGSDQGLWHLDRSDERQIDDGGLDGYYAWCSTPNQVRAYVVDTGVRASHLEFASGQVTAGYDALPTQPGTASDPCSPTYPFNSTNCCGFHGTAVASVLGGITYGYAKYVTIVPVRVIGCNGAGTTATVVAGLEWIRDNGILPAVINMSFFTPHTATLQNTLLTLKQDGYVIFTSANNFPTEDACSKAPAQYARGNGGPVITVGGTMIGQNGDAPHNITGIDYRWQEYDGLVAKTGQDGGSSFGPCVDIWAPARNIRVASYQDPSQSLVLSGTSFSSPLVAGMVIDGYLRTIYSPNSTTADEAWSWLLSQTSNSGATTHDSSGVILVRDRKTTPHGRMAFQQQGCRRRLVN